MFDVIIRLRLNEGWPDFEPCQCGGILAYWFSHGNRAAYRCVSCRQTRGANRQTRTTSL